jgi:hypothetical protein
MRLRGTKRKGAVYATVLLGLLALMGMTALAVDVGIMTVAKQQLQAAADAAALAGVVSLQSNLDTDIAASVAIATAAANRCMGTSVTLDPDVDIAMGAWDDETGELIPFDTSSGATIVPDGVVAVQVTARRTDDSPDGPIQLQFARALGKESVGMQASSTGGLTVAQRERPAVEAQIVQDQSGSFADEFPFARTADQEFVEFMGECNASGDKVGITGFGYHSQASKHLANGALNPDYLAKQRDTWTFHNYGLHDMSEGMAGRDAVSNYIGNMATVAYNAAPNYNCWTNLYAGLIKAGLQFFYDTGNATQLAAMQAKIATFEAFLQTFTQSRTYYDTYLRKNVTETIKTDIGWWNNHTKITASGAYYNQYRDTVLKTKINDLLSSAVPFANPDAEHVVVLVSDGMPWYAANGFPDTKSQAISTYIVDRLAARGVRVHTVTLDQSDEPGDGSAGSDTQFNASLVRNGGYAFYTYDAERLSNLLVGVGQVEVGQAHLMN